MTGLGHPQIDADLYQAQKVRNLDAVIHALKAAISGSDNYDHTLPVSYFVEMLAEERRRNRHAEAALSSLRARVREVTEEVSKIDRSGEPRVSNVRPLYAAPPAPASVPMVKSLEWVKHPVANAWRVDTMLGTYKVWAGSLGVVWQFDSLLGEHLDDGSSGVEAAKAAAQADYERRILAALSDAPAREGVVAPNGLSPLPWTYHNRPDFGSMGKDWIEDAHGNIVVENIGHIDGPFVCAVANAASPTGEDA